MRVTRDGEWWVADVEGLDDGQVRTQEWSQLDPEVRALIGDLTGGWPDDLELDWVES